MVQTILRKKQAAVLKRWRELILQTYSSHGAEFMQREKDQFANPVGDAIDRGTGVLLAGVLAGEDARSPDMTAALDDLIKIRAVQDFSAAEAVSFIFLLKQIFREELADRDVGADEILELDNRVDLLTLAAFDIYTKNREKICDIKVNMVKRRVFKLLEQSDILDERSRFPGNPDNGDSDASSLKGGAGT